MTQEHERAIAQAERNAAEAADFDSDEHKYGPRPNQRLIFRAGFNAGWDLRDAVGVNRVEEIARLTGENANLRDLLLEALPMLRELGMQGDEPPNLYRLTVEIKKALNGHDADMLSDGEIYEAASRRAAPEWHAKMDKLLGINDGGAK